MPGLEQILAIMVLRWILFSINLIRELLEESGVVANSLSRVGLINFEFENDPVILEVHIFKTSDYTGKPVETEEMRPQWYEEESVPFDKMWPDDHIWFPYMLNNKMFEAYFLFQGMDIIVSHWIKEVDSLDSVNVDKKF
ncbi:7,8-dihydro-8-oxoguanine triphosphatase [Plakobranchus ocellatus]|uniref:7,8-dihydro-8-oxoguanine triphosphatase n=1 Tax=Plakobranchus ocellatus TaxID=259542 RepID=A0AAV4D434_9GAST|nr:7,8-dihydro-8-oxoguanine triphosphatase [Plakobranchus ocellatus]